MSILRNFQKYAAALMLTVAVAAPVAAIDLPVTTVNGKDYYYYDVQPGETLFSLSQRLGIPREEIVNYNPGVEGGLKAYARLYFPIESGVTSISAGDHVTTSHEVTKGETLYGISKKYGITVDNLIAMNPEARDGINPGDILVIRQEEVPVDKANNSGSKNGGTHVIAPGETLYRIAVNNGYTVEQLLAANPEIDANNYTEGTVIRFPGGANEEIAQVDVDLKPVAEEKAAKPEVAPKAPEAKAENKTTKTENKTVSAGNTNTAENTTPSTVSDNSEIDPAATDEARDPQAPFTIAVMLPFNLNEENPGKEAENFTEFYRGFLLGAQSMSKSGHKVNIVTYDTKGDAETVKEIMSKPEIKDIDVFVAPPSSAELDCLIENVDSDRQFIFNNFAVRNNSYLTNQNLLQANIPHTSMYQKAIDAFMSEMGGRIPVFVQRKGAQADKEEFTAMLKSQLSDKGIEFKEIIFDHSLTDDDFAEYDKQKSYVVVPLSSSANEFNKIVPAVKRFKESVIPAVGVTIFGYPEWLTFRGDRLDNLGALNATIYSRFYLDNSYYPARKVAENYRQAYGRDMNSAVPSQAFMGYDVATFLIKSLRANNGDFHSNIIPFDGLQSDFNFSDSDCEGLVNTAVELIKFRDGGFTEHSLIK